MISYVTFDTVNGDIKGISNIEPSISEDTNISYTKVDYDQIEHILLGKESTRAYCVQYNPATEVFEFKMRTNFSADDLTINDLIYKVPTVDNYNAHIVIIQDIPNTCWKILIHRDLEVKLRSELIGLHTTIHFALTEYNNPNILLKTLTVNLNQLVKNHYQILEFKEEFEQDVNFQFSIFVVKRFESYSYVRINE